MKKKTKDSPKTKEAENTCRSSAICRWGLKVAILAYPVDSLC